MMKQLILIALMATMLTACSSVPRILDFNSAPIERSPLVLPEVDTFSSREVQWVVVTPENVNNVIRDLEKSDNNIVLFALTDDGYENLSLNMADIIKLIRQQRAIIAAYEQYYEQEEQ